MGCSIFNYFQQILIAVSFEPQMLQNLLELFFEACLTTPQLLPTS